MIIFIPQLTPALEAVNSYRIHDPRTEKLQERPDGEFEIGLKLFPDLTGPPPPVAIATTSSSPTRSRCRWSASSSSPRRWTAALDSLAHALELIRRENTQLIVTLGYPQAHVPLPGRTFNDARRPARSTAWCAGCAPTS